MKSINVNIAQIIKQTRINLQFIPVFITENLYCKGSQGIENVAHTRILEKSTTYQILRQKKFLIQINLNAH